MNLTDEDFGRLFEDFQHTAFRLETLDFYDIPGDRERLEAFLAGKPAPPAPSKQAWLQVIAAAKAAGKRMQRVHALAEPLTDYLRFELLEGYPPNAAAGEEIFIRRIEPGAWPNDLPREDFWLFDGERVARMHYDQGRYVGAELVERHENPAIVDRYCRWQEAALHGAISLSSYLDQHLRAAS
jgi:hypothetical protein